MMMMMVFDDERQLRVDIFLSQRRWRHGHGNEHGALGRTLKFYIGHNYERMIVMLIMMALLGRHRRANAHKHTPLVR